MTTDQLLEAIANLGADTAVLANNAELTESQRAVYADQVGALRSLYSEVRRGRPFLLALAPCLQHVKTEIELRKLTEIRDRYVKEVGR